MNMVYIQSISTGYKCSSDPLQTSALSVQPVATAWADSRRGLACPPGEGHWPCCASLQAMLGIMVTDVWKSKICIFILGTSLKNRVGTTGKSWLRMENLGILHATPIHLGDESFLSKCGLRCEIDDDPRRWLFLALSEQAPTYSLVKSPFYWSNPMVCWWNHMFWQLHHTSVTSHSLPLKSTIWASWITRFLAGQMSQITFFWQSQLSSWSDP